MSKDHEAPPQDAPVKDTPEQSVPAHEPVQPAAQPPSLDRSSLSAEANRLKEFKSQKVKKNNKTQCPACATLVHIDASLCPHCNTDIAANNALVRESLRRLDEINAQLGPVRRHTWTSRVTRLFWPATKKIQGFIVDPTRRDDLRILIPSLLVFFALVIALRATGNTMLFWSVSIVGAVAAYLLLGRSRTRRFVTLDFYRLALVVGTALIMTTAMVRPTSFSGGTARASVIVEPAVVNIRNSATIDSRIVTTVRKGDKLEVIEREDLWYKVKTPDGKTGYVFSRLVKD